MASSGTTANLFDVSDVMEEAFERAGLDPAELDSRRIVSARRSLNLLLQDMGNQDADREYYRATATVTSVANTSEYTLSTLGSDLAHIWTIQYLDTGGTYHTMTRMSYRDDIGLNNASATGIPRQWRLDRAGDGDPASDYVLHVWPAPSVSGESLLLTYYRRPDNVTGLSQDIDIARYWQEAIMAGLAAKIAQKWNLDRYPALRAEFMDAYNRAQMESNPRTDVVVAARGYGFPRRARH